MSNPRQVIEAFLKDKAAIYAEANSRLSDLQAQYLKGPLFEIGNALLLRDPLTAVVEKVEQSNDSAMVTTREPGPLNNILRQRYSLSRDGERWKIVRLYRECFLCRGSGKLDGVVCSKCAGEGWYGLHSGA